MRGRVPMVCGTLATILIAAAPVAAEQAIVAHPAASGVSRPLRALPAAESFAAASQALTREVPVRRPRELPQPDVGRAPIIDSVAQLSAPLPAMPGFSSSFEGLANTDNAAVFGFTVVPPDPNMAVGPNHIVQWANIVMAVYNKAGTKLKGPTRLSSLFTGLGTACDPNVSGNAADGGDAVFVYDHLADRWLLTQFTDTVNPHHLCIALSKTGDPTGAYFVYDFPVPGNKFFDYPKYGIWPDAYYASGNLFNAAGTASLGAAAVAFDRTKMLVGDPAASMIYFDLQATRPEVGNMLPASLDGPPPPPGTPNYFAYFIASEFLDATDGLRLFEFHADFVNPANATFTERSESPIATAAFNPLLSCGSSGRDCIPQPSPAGSSARLDALNDRLMHRLQYRNFGTHESLVTNHTVDATGSSRAGIRYYELRRALPGGSFGIDEQATFSPDTNQRWMGSAAMDVFGNIAVGYSVSSTTVFPSIRYAGRLSTDPPGGLFQGEATLRSGSGSQTSTSSRWGDYTMLAVDPADGCTFWYVNEYYPVSSSTGWHTRIGSFSFPACGGAPPLSADVSIAMTDAPDPVASGSSLTYSMTIHNAGPDPATGVTVTDTLPFATVFSSASASQGSCTFSQGTVNCALGVLASGADATVSLTVTVQQVTSGSVSNTATVSADQPDPDDSNNSATTSTTVQQPADLRITAMKGPPATRARGSSFNATDTTKNFGPGAAPASTTRYYLSLDKLRSAGDILLTGSRSVPSLLAGTLSHGTAPVTIPADTPPGKYFLIACADDLGVVIESNETNNCRSSVGRINVTP